MINFDFQSYMSRYVKKEDKVKYLEKAKEIKERFVNGDLEYWNKIDTFISKKELIKMINITDYVKENCDVFVVIGIGGSYMGSKAIIEALSPIYNREKPEIIFLGTNLNASEYFETLEYLKDKEVVVNVISKSGTTLEPSIAFTLIMELLEKKYNKEELKDRIIVTTDATSGELRKEATENEYISFEIPGNVGGRFSCLTAVGLLPISVAGLNIAKILDGARKANRLVDRAIEYAVIRDILYNKGKYIESFTVYDSKLYYFTEWLKQLFAETQGKEGKAILPISSVNTRDLHSLGQYFQEGKDIIFETVLAVEKDEKVLLSKYDMELNTLNTIAVYKVAEAHYNGYTPSNLIKIEEIDETTIGELVSFFIVASISGALLLDVNPFDQPGVQEYKRLIEKELK